MKRKRVGAAIAVCAVAVGLTVPAGTAVAASPAQEACEADGGVYTKAPGSTASCVFPEESVANENANPDNNAQTTQDTTTGQGNLGNRTEDTCTGPPGQCN
jgi:hypothetical protein